jgi:hypothetical protein
MSRGNSLPLSPTQLLARARAMTNIDIADDGAVEPLTVLIRSFNEEGMLHEAGAVSVQDRLLRALANRLRMLRDFAAHPEIREQRVHEPIFIAGYLRTGSTKLQRMLAASGDFNYLPLWKTLNPSSLTGVPGENPAPRIADAEQHVRDLYAGSPEAAAVHEQGAHLAEEESYIFCQDLRCAGYLSYANVPSYLDWLAAQDMAGTYEYLLDALKYLQWQGLADPNRRWLLKSQFHLGQESTLARTFPDATLLFTHRPPVQFLSSICSLMASYMKWHTDHTRINGPAIVAGFAFSIDRHFAFREGVPSLPFLDIDYRDATANSASVIRRVYEHLGIPLSERAWRAMQEWERANPIHRHGSHRYSAEDFGLTEDFVHAQCRRYEDFYQSCLASSAEGRG